jgi:DnaA-homolog protein
MKQIPLPIGAHIAEPEPTFGNFLPGANGPAVAHLLGLASSPAPVYLWGAGGTGKSHLLRAFAAQRSAQGGRVGFFGASCPLPWNHEADWAAVIIDDCDGLDAEQQQAAFSLFVECATHGTSVLAAGSLPPVDLPLREDLRSRLGWGHVFALQPLSEAETRSALRREADRRGVILTDEVMDYLLTRFERNLKHLLQMLDRLDDFSLTYKRIVTVPMIRKMLAEEPD